MGEYKSVRSVTCLTLEWMNKEVTRVEVEREQVELGEFDLADMDIIEAVKSLHPTYIKEIADALAYLPRVKRIKITRVSDGKGIVIEP